MSKSQNQKVTSTAQNLSGQAQSEMSPYISGLSGQQSKVASSNQQPAYSSAFDTYNNAASTGGFDPGQYSSTLGGYNALAGGGFTPAQERQYMDQATSGVTNTYNVLARQVAQNKAKTGGLGGGGEVSQMARQLGQQQAAAEQGAAVNLNQLETANKTAGLSGASSLQAAQAGNKLAAAGGLSNLYNTATGQITSLGQQTLDAMGIKYNTQAEALRALQALATSPGSSQGILGNIAQIGGMVAGGAMGAL